MVLFYLTVTTIGCQCTISIILSVKVLLYNNAVCKVQKKPPRKMRGGLVSVDYSVSPEISLIAETVAARFCMSLGTISLVALPSATFSMASMLRRAR